MSKANQTEEKMQKSSLDLSVPITAHGEDGVQTLYFARPTGKDVRELGFPYKIGRDDSMSIQADIVAKYISRLASIPLSSVDMLDPSDMIAGSNIILGFFQKSGETEIA